MVGRTPSRQGNQKIMSLINEALKKAQGQRPHAARQTPPPEGVGVPAPPQQPPKRRNLLWGFLIVIIFVGLFSAGMATFLVYQILGPCETEQATGPSSPPASTAATVPDTSGEAPVQQQQTPPAPTAKLPAPAEENAIAASVETSPAPAMVIPPLSGQGPAEPGPAEGAVWERLAQLEIRGIMSGGSRVLIFDKATGKTKAFEPGEALEGPLGLKVATISPSAIVFQDHGGVPHSKSF